MSPTKPRRMDGYIRVSRVGTRNTESESYITEDVQREKIEMWAKLRGVEIATWHVDRDQSGSKLTRPGFDTMMARVASGKTEGVVVAAIDRLSRADVADALMIVREIHDDHGGTLAAVDLGIDPTTEVGEMLLTVLLALARMQWRRYQAAWATAKDRAIKRGAHVGPTPQGYSRGDDSRLVPDPATAPVIQEAFRLAATQGLRAATDHLRTADLTLERRHPQSKVQGYKRIWTTGTTRRLLESRVYLGEIRSGDVANTEAHEPLVDLATWTAANLANGTQGYRPEGQYSLSGVVQCASCGTGTVGSRTGTGGRLRSYRCKRNKQRAVVRGEQEACPAPAMVSADALEEYVQAELVRFAATQKPDDTVTLVEGGDQADVERAEAALKSAELSRSKDATNTRLIETLGEENFYARMGAHNLAVDKAQAEYETAVASAQPEVTWPLADEVATATAADLPILLERCGLTVKLSPGRGNLPERVELTQA